MESLSQSHDRDDRMDEDPPPHVLLDDCWRKVQLFIAKFRIPRHIVDGINRRLSQLPDVLTDIVQRDIAIEYLNWFMKLPWNEYSVDRNVRDAINMLNQEVDGLTTVKTQLVQLIMNNNRGILQERIICLCGPPAMGKTKIGVSVATAFNRKYFKLFPTRLVDVATIIKGSFSRGEPGEMVKELTTEKTFNPLVLVESIDKFTCHTGVETVLELLDSSQNAFFKDDYLGYAIDLSKVVFVCTANQFDKIPAFLSNKLEMIFIDAYITDEKMLIARRLEPSIRAKCGIKNEQVELTERALCHIIDYYCDEPGVNDVKERLHAIYKKVPLILELSTTQESLGIRHLVIDVPDLKNYIGGRLFLDMWVNRRTNVGNVNGLGCNQMKGTLSLVEVVKAHTSVNNGIHPLSFVDDTMRRSIYIAYDYAIFYEETQLGTNFIRFSPIHIDFPGVGGPISGPSAGISIVTALLSLAMNRRVTEHLAMTGEITLGGAILRVGGIKQKVDLARRCNIRTLILPSDNKEEYEQLPEVLTQRFQVHFVDEYAQVFELSFP